MVIAKNSKFFFGITAKIVTLIIFGKENIFFNGKTLHQLCLKKLEILLFKAKFITSKINKITI